MDFTTIYNETLLMFSYMINQLKLFFQKIGSYQLIIFALMVTVAIPSMIHIFDLIASVADDSDELADNAFSWYRLFRRKISTEGKTEREAFRVRKHTENFDRANKMAQEFFKEHPMRFSVKINGFSFKNKHFQQQKHTSYSSAGSSVPKTHKRVDDRALDIAVDDNS